MRKHLILVLVVIAGATVMIAGCTSSSSPSPSPSASATTTAVSSATVAADAAAALGGNASNATNLTAVQGQNFMIQLPSNSSIGNGNHWALSLYDASSVTLVNQTYVGGSVSAPGPRADVFTFQGTKTGTSVITFNCVSPTNQIENTVKYTINCTTLNVPTVNAVYISHGQDFAIRLPSNPSTGYHWELSLYDNSTLKLVNQTFASNVSTSSTVVGAGGTDVFTFQATQAGTGGIAFSEMSPANQPTSAVVYSVVIAS
ncbi:MAG: protease inhibitor I42 family protein [Halobacteriota archaeon]